MEERGREMRNVFILIQQNAKLCDGTNKNRKLGAEIYGKKLFFCAENLNVIFFFVCIVCALGAEGKTMRIK